MTSPRFLSVTRHRLGWLRRRLTGHVVEDSDDLMLPSFTADGRLLSGAERMASPFVACIDEPGSHEVSKRDLSTCRFRGWVASTADRPTKVVARIEDGPRQEFAADHPRPDVVQSEVGRRFRITSERCGYSFDLDLSGIPGASHVVALEFTDGEFVASPKPFVIRRIGDGASSGIPGSPPSYRGNYKDVWNEVSRDANRAKTSVAGYADEAELREAAEHTLRALERSVGVATDDVILEIGAGVGRVGTALAPRCRKWIGTDVSENMIRHATERLSGFDNVELVVTSGWDLAPIEPESVDLVYCTVVFMHLDEWDRYKYVLEAMRILKPGGRVYVDNFNLLGDMGWAFFVEAMDQFAPLERPANISKSSTPQELQAYLERAGFDDIGIEAHAMWVSAYGTKPTG